MKNLSILHRYAKNHRKNWLSLASVLLMSALDAHADIGIIDTGAASGTFVYNKYLSADGSTIVGSYNADNGDIAIYKYTESGGMVTISNLGGRNTYVDAISADGSVLVGNSEFSNREAHAYKHTDSTGMVDLGTLGGKYSAAYDVSADGSVVVGYSDIANGDSRAFKHTGSGGMIDLGTLGGNSSYANAVSADGRVVAGDSSLAIGGGKRAFKYTDKDGMVNLGTLGGSYSTAIQISADGSTIIGNSALITTENHAYKHTDSGGIVDLGTLGGPDSYATQVSADGSVTVGHSAMANGMDVQAFKHTDSGGMIGLGTLGGAYSYTSNVSANGEVVIGYSNLAGGSIHAYKHTDSGGIVDLGTLGGSNSIAYDLSADGSVIIGQAMTVNNNWHAVLWKDKAIVDADNTRTALAQTAQQASQVIDMRSAQLQMLMQQDCRALISNGRFCIGAGAVYSGSSNARDTAASFTLGYQIAPQWRIGTTINQSLDNTLPSEYKSSNNLPGIGVFSTFNARKDGLGWQARVAAAYQKSRLDINRKQLSYTEGGIGRADLNGAAATVEGSYGMLGNNGIVIAPYAALRYSSVRRSAYNESNDVAFVGRYGEMGRSATSIDAGLRVGKTINSKLNLSADIGVTRDIAVNNQGFNVAMDYVGGFALGNGDDERTRAHLGVQGSYALAKDSAIQGGIYWAQQAYGNDSSSAQLRLIRQF